MQRRERERESRSRWGLTETVPSGCVTAVAAATAAPLVPKWYSAPPCPGCIPLPELGWKSIKSPWKEKKKIGEKVEKKRRILFS